MPAISLNMLETYTLMAIGEEIVPRANFFRDRYFPTDAGDLFASDKVLTEYRKGDRKMASFVSPRVGDIPMDRRGYEIHEYQPAFIAPSRPLTADELNKRGFGEALYSQSTQAQRAARLLQDDLRDMDLRIERREEWMCAKTMIDNGCTMQEYLDDKTKGDTLIVKFYDTATEHKYTPAKKWNAAGATYADFKNDVIAACRLLTRRGLPAEDMVASFADGSKESVDAIAGMAQAAQDGGGKLEAMVKNWQDLQQAQKDASGALADLTTDFSSKMDELAQKAGDTVDELDMSAEAAKNGKATVQAFIDSASNMLPDVQTAYAKIGTTAANALQSKLDKANTSGRAQKTGAQATGTRNAEPGWTLVGEYGPEIVYMQGGEGVLNAAQTKDVLPALDDRYTDTRAENAEAPAPKETAQAAESAAVNPHEGIRNDTRAAQTPATTARVMPQTADGPAEAVSAPAVNQPKVDIPQEVEAAQEPVSAAVAADVPDTVSAAEPFSGIPENGMQYAETVQAEDAYPASAAQPAAEAAAFAPAEADKVDIPLDGQTPENGLSAAEMNHAAEADAMLADYTAVISPRAVDAMGSFAAQNAKPAAEAVQAESAKSSTTTQLQPMSLSPVFQISGMQDSQQLRSALNQSVEDMRQMILDVVQSARDDEERMNFS